MTYLERWNQIVGAIRGFENACRLHQQFLLTNTSDTHGTWRKLNSQAIRLRDEISIFRDTFESQLPSAALDRIANSLTTDLKIITAEGNIEQVRESAKALIVRLVAFEAEFSYLLQDRQVTIWRRSERAFLHLQRSIAADPEIRAKWKAAFKRETELEKLGSVHLLLHGIWAFKADAGARTDLIFGERIETYVDELSAASGLVLTEWKKATKASEVEGKFSEARSQAQSYSQGPLAGIELTTYRYLVVVTAKQAVEPRDEIANGVTYRHISIAVDPDMPSVAARNRAQ